MSSEDLPNFSEVNDRVYRGGQPRPDGFPKLKELGIATVIYLRGDGESAVHEEPLVEQAGMRFVNFPLHNWRRPSTKDMERILAAISDPANHPVFVHCRRGADRTGTVMAVYRMVKDGWTARQAGDEAIKFGIGWWQWNMRDYINDYYKKSIQKSMGFIENYHADALQSFRNYKKLAERAIEQVSDEEFFALIDPEANSIAVIVKHIAGNLNSRWRDFLKSDGEKTDRHRDTEFELIDETRVSLMEFWERGWQTLFDAIEPLTEKDFSKTVTIRGEPHTIVEAINRQMTHYPLHIGQIVMLAKHFRAAEWKTLSVPKNRSAEFNQFLAERREKGEPTVARTEAPLIFSEIEQKKNGPE